MQCSKRCWRPSSPVAVALVTAFVAVLLMSDDRAESQDKRAEQAVLVLHGGAGALARAEMTAQKRAAYEADLRRALQAGYQAWKANKSALDMVEAAIVILEDSPRFNAGVGAVFNAEGQIAHDASIMEGKERKAGAVGAVQRIKNPIRAARAVMNHSRHVLLVADGAERFAARHGLAMVDPVHFWTETRWQQLLKARRQQQQKKKGERAPGDADHGTVGAVALDQKGTLAAGTSTGGLTNRLPGRLGDSPIIGAGTYADNETCAVSGTGHGEYFIRFAVAHDIAARMRYQRQTVQQAAEAVVLETLKKAGGDGGVIALDARGNFAMPFNTEGMYRGYIRRDGKAEVFIYEQ